jgi:serine/threonine-protein kinase
MPAVGEVLAGRYRIDARLGAGGMATVWKARDLRLERDVAVKVLLPNLAGDPALAARFDREARTLAALSHPHVVGIHDVSEGGPGGEPFIVMELCRDGSLGDRLAGDVALTPTVALPILAGAATGLAALHARGIVHRDVTPRNILLADGTSRLGDLGLARAEGMVTPPGGGLTATGTAVGTVGYLAPELLDGRSATPASDVYGLGAVAYRTLTGSLPRPAGSIADLVAARNRPVAPLAGAVVGLPAVVSAAVDRALDPDPARRPTAGDLASALGAAVPPELLPDERTATDLRSGAPVRPPIGKKRRGPRARALPGASVGYHGPGFWSGEAVAVIGVVIVIIVVVVLLGGRPG